MRRAAALCLLVLAALALTTAGAIQVPSAVRLGGEVLPAASCATRETLWLHHYVAALYVPRSAAPVAALQDPASAKALQVQILSRLFLPSEIPPKYRFALEQTLDAETLASIRLAWRQLAVGDRVTLAYAPGSGLSLMLNEHLVAKTPRHDVIDVLLRAWADAEPVRERVDRVVARHPCPA
jgi:hypothetical protein